MSTPAYRAKILPLHSVWLDLLILRMMGYCEDHMAKPVWFVLDELASLNKLPQLHTAVTENRKYGNPVVVGFQGRSQLEKRYGQDAEAMLSQPATKLLFKTTEPRAAKWISDAIGEIEVERLKEVAKYEAARKQEIVCDGDCDQAACHGSQISSVSNRCMASSSRRTALFRFTSSSQRSTADNRSSLSANCRRLRPGRHRRRR